MEIEADFQREYKINLPLEINSMTWRRFSILLGGLSSNSVYIQIKQGEKDGSIPIEMNEIQSDRIMREFF